MAALGLHCCMRAFSCYGQWGYSSLLCADFSLRWPLLLQGTGSRRMGFSTYGAQVWLPRAMWVLPGPGMESVSLELAGGFLTCETSEKSGVFLSMVYSLVQLSALFRWGYSACALQGASQLCNMVTYYTFLYTSSSLSSPHLAWLPWALFLLSGVGATSSAGAFNQSSLAGGSWVAEDGVTPFCLGPRPCS